MTFFLEKIKNHSQIYIYQLTNFRPQAFIKPSQIKNYAILKDILSAFCLFSELVTYPNIPISTKKKSRQ